MPYTNINAQLPDADVQAIKAAFDTIAQKLPFLISLTNAERMGLRKTGTERLGFVMSAAQAAQNNPTILPASFDAAGFQAAVALFSALTDVNGVSQQVCSKIDDTHLDVGVQLMDEASDVYKYVKTAAKKTSGLKPVAIQLGQLYQKAVATRNANKKTTAAAK